MKVFYMRINLLFSSILTGLLVASAGSALAIGAEDEAKLKAFEQALKNSAASDKGNTATEGAAKRRTRAIVFDNDQQAANPANPATTDVATQPTARVDDCSKLSPDAKAVTVDFAIQFKVGSADVAASSEDTLRQISKILALAPDRCVLVEGHSDASGNVNANMALSKDRAVSVVRFIVDKAGLDKGRFFAIGKGPHEPLKNLDPRDAKNRRVVFKVVG